MCIISTCLCGCTILHKRKITSFREGKLTSNRKSDALTVSNIVARLEGCEQPSPESFSQKIERDNVCVGSLPPFFSGSGPSRQSATRYPHNIFHLSQYHIFKRMIRYNFFLFIAVGCHLMSGISSRIMDTRTCRDVSGGVAGARVTDEAAQQSELTGHSKNNQHATLR